MDPEVCVLGITDRVFRGCDSGLVLLYLLDCAIAFRDGYWGKWYFPISSG